MCLHQQALFLGTPPGCEAHSGHRGGGGQGGPVDGAAWELGALENPAPSRGTIASTLHPCRASALHCRQLALPRTIADSCLAADLCWGWELSREGTGLGTFALHLQGGHPSGPTGLSPVG